MAYAIASTRVLVFDPRPSSLPDILTVAHMGSSMEPCSGACEIIDTWVQFHKADSRRLRCLRTREVLIASQRVQAPKYLVLGPIHDDNKALLRNPERSLYWYLDP